VRCPNPQSSLSIIGFGCSMTGTPSSALHSFARYIRTVAILAILSINSVACAKSTPSTAW